MGPILFSFLRGVTLFLAGATAFAAGGPDVKKSEVNGLDVYLVNTHVGNGVALTVNIQGGSWHDDPVRHAGRSHLWEHVIHSGSKRFPGKETFDNVMKRAGGSYNAYTAHNRVFFHAYLHPAGLEEAAALLGAAISEPEWNQESFEAEKKNVMNEAAEYQQADGLALSSLMWLQLLPQGHPLAMYDVGTQAQLAAMGLDDLKELYYSNYRPGSMQVIVAGNFDRLPGGEAPLTEERVLGLLRANFHPADITQDPAGFRAAVAPMRQKKFPSIVAEGSPRYLEVGTQSDQRMLAMVFEAAPELALARPEVLEVLIDYLNLQNDGSFTDSLKKKGWIAGGGFFWRTVNQLTTVEGSFALTEAGAEHRKEILDLLCSKLHDLSRHGVSPSMLSYLISRNVVSYSQGVRSAAQSAEFLAKSLDYASSSPTDALDFVRRFGGIRGDDFKNAVDQAFPADRMLAAYLGPDVRSGTTDPVFERPVAVDRGTAFPERWKRLRAEGGLTDPHAEVRLARVDLRISREPLTGAVGTGTAVIRTGPATTGILGSDHAYATGGIAVELALAPFSARSEVALDLFLATLQDRYTTELDYLGSIGVQLELSNSGGKLMITSEGNSEAALSAVEWLTALVPDFVPTSREIDDARSESRINIRQSWDEFTASIANRAADALLSRGGFTDQEYLSALEGVTREEVIRLARQKLARADILASFEGDFDESRVRGLLGVLRGHFPSPLTERQRGRRASSSTPIRASAAFWEPLRGTKGEDALAITRVLQGPPALSREHAAWSVLGEALSKKIFELNRTQKGLGYVHGASDQVSLGGGFQMKLYGQTEGRANLLSILDGWKEILGRVERGELSDDHYEADITGMVRSEGLIPVKQSRRAESRLAAFELSGNPDAFDALVEQIRNLQPEEIDQVGRRYLLRGPSLDVIAAKERPEPVSCLKLLTSPAAARRKVSGKS